MLFQVYAPPESLRSYIHSIQVMEIDREEKIAKQKIVPYGFCGLFFHYKESCLQTDNIRGKRLLPKSFVAGLTDQPIVIDPLGDTGTIAVNFYPTGLYHFVKSPVNEFTNATLISEDVLGNEIKLLEESLSEKKDAAQRVNAVNNFLLKRFKKLNPEINGTDHALQLVLSSRGQLNINEMVRNIGTSMSTLERNFRKQVGLSPKQYASITRFNNVFQLIRLNGFTHWHDIVYECGYFDQAHFIKDFTRFTGESPRTYFARQVRLGEFYSGK